MRYHDRENQECLTGYWFSNRWLSMFEILSQHPDQKSIRSCTTRNELREIPYEDTYFSGLATLTPCQDSPTLLRYHMINPYHLIQYYTKYIN
jgi:hypothetical protein